MPWLRQLSSDSGPFLVIRVSLGIPRFYPKSVLVEFVVGKVALEQVLLPVLRFPAVSFIQPKLHLIATVSGKTNSRNCQHSHAVADIGEAFDSNALFLLEELR